jgi:hypothetical protein
MVCNTGPVNEHEARSAIIPFVGIVIQKNMNCDNNATSFYKSACCDTERKLTLSGDKMCCLQFGASAFTIVIIMNIIEV